VGDDGKLEIILGHHWSAKDLHHKHPADLLKVEQGHLKSPLLSTDIQAAWKDLIDISPTDAGPSAGPKLLLRLGW
jgi:hypothetical protein